MFPGEIDPELTSTAPPPNYLLKESFHRSYYKPPPHVVKD